MKSKIIDEVKEYLASYYDKDKTSAIIKDAQKRFEIMCLDNNEDSKDIKKHTEVDIYPCIALYEAMLKLGIDKAEATNFLDETWSKKCEASAKSMAKILKIFKLYKLYPTMFKSVAKKSFGESAGFKAKYYNEGKGHCHFDMTKCLFKDRCDKYGYPELVKCFCHTDDVNNRDLNPNLVWDRKCYMGKGDNYCDFNLYVKKK